jgi:hypothetical protein
MPGSRIAALLLGCSGWFGCDAAFDLEAVPVPPDMAPLCIEDAFDGSQIDTSTWIVVGAPNGVTAKLEAKALRVDVPAQTTASQDLYGGIKSGTLNLTYGMAEVDMLQGPPAAQTSLSGLSIGPDQQNYYNMFVQTGQLVARSYVAATRDDVVKAYDPARHLHLRIRHEHASDMIVFETRGADTGWTIAHQVPRAFSLESADVTLFASSYDVAPAYSSLFDNVAIYATCSP